MPDANNQPQTPDTPPPTSVVGIAGVAIKWATSQGFNNTLLVLILLAAIGGIGGFAYWAADAIPKHITMIQGGYEKIDAAHATQRAEERKDHAEQLKAQQDAFKEVIADVKSTVKETLNFISEKQDRKERENNKSAVAGKP